MKIKRLFTGLALFFLVVFTVPKVNAESSVAAPSAKLTEINDNSDETVRKVTIEAVLSRYDSPLLGSASSFVNSANRYQLDPYLLVSISGLESYFGNMMVDGSYNAYGWGGGWIYFESWEDGIETISKGLRENYYDRGAQNLDQVGAMYAESPTWSVRVAGFMRLFEAEEQKIRSAVLIL